MESPNDPTCDVILNGEQISEFPVETIRPQPVFCSGFNQLRSHPNATRSFPHATFQDIANTELRCDIRNTQRIRLVIERGTLCDYEKIAGAGQERNNVLAHTIGKIFLLRVTTHVLERQHGDGWLVAECTRGSLTF